LATSSGEPWDSTHWDDHIQRRASPSGTVPKIWCHFERFLRPTGAGNPQDQNKFPKEQDGNQMGGMRGTVGGPRGVRKQKFMRQHGLRGPDGANGKKGRARLGFGVLLFYGGVFVFWWSGFPQTGKSRVWTIWETVNFSEI